MPVFADVTLARRLECAERDANARFVEARASIDPAVGATWIDVNGTYAMFDGVASPCTQTFGFGLFAAPSERDLDAIESFFRERSAPIFHEVCPIADAAHLALLGDRGYRPIEYSSVLYRSVDGSDVSTSSESAAIDDTVVVSPSDDGVTVRVVRRDETDRWARTLAAGWSDVEGVGPMVSELARVMAARPDMHLFLGEIEGRAVAAASLSISEGVALLSGASTRPDARRRGAQSALLAARLRRASAYGCDLAMVVALPGSGSQRNAERNGFRIAYTRTKWQLQIASGTSEGKPA